ncbi:hypothetical protein [Herpetosiphon giganteus]|uniref:hypothetical protein n=1 Tax=Herpetosiphon giganteus TaxID=2029754 RepID=UPI00195C4A1D|nr:hypothetical protein [Herpetosiphon giganteus]MBM7842586.1 hypothetical protein [Herpetosiphon giganteus]
MQLAYIPSLLRQRAIYDLPLGPARFEAYLASMTNQKRDGLEWPFAPLNPMGKAHVPVHYDALLAFDAEAIAQQTMSELQTELPALDCSIRVTLVVVDDALGGWTQPNFTDWAYRFSPILSAKSNWLPVYSWTSVVPTPELVRQAIRAAIYRAGYRLVHGEAQTLGAMLHQEGAVTRFAGQVLPHYHEDELAAMAERIAEYLNSHDQPTQFAAFYGDEIAIAVGYPSLGLPAYAGLVVATKATAVDPISLLTA